MPGKADTEGIVIIAPLKKYKKHLVELEPSYSVQGALAVLLVASQLVAFVQLPEAHGGSESAPAAGRQDQQEQQQKRQQQQLLGVR